MTALWADPLYRSLPVAAIGMVARLVEHFWITECRPLPIDRDQLHSIARGHKATWARYREDILTVMGRWGPVAATALDHRRRGLDSLKLAPSAMNARRRLTRLEKTHNPPEVRSEPRPLNPVGQSSPAPETARIWTD